MKFINIYINFIDKLNDKIGSLTSWLTALLVLVVSYDVIVRYLVEESSVGLQEFEWHLFALIFLLSAAYYNFRLARGSTWKRGEKYCH